jgi:hypothetical protein
VRFAAGTVARDAASEIAYRAVLAPTSVITHRSSSPMILRLLCGVFAALALLAGCARFPRAPAPGSPYLATKFCGFVFDGRTKEARFTIDLVVQRPLPGGALVEATFENPLERDQPIVVTREVKGNERELRIVSTPVKGITQREYAMAVRIYPTRDKTTLLATHTESCRAPFGQGDVGVEYR